MKITHLIPLFLLVGCVSQPSTFNPVPLSRTNSIAVTAKTPPLPTPLRVMAQPMLVRVVTTNQPPPAPRPQVTSTGTIAPSTNCMIIRWMLRPLSYSIDTSTNLLSWRSLGTSITTNFVPAPGQVLVQTNLFPSGQAVTFTNGNPAIVFIDYDIDSPTKFYRIREVQP